MRIIVGAGSTMYRGWTGYQQDELDLTKPEQWAEKFAPASLDVILAEHVFEHLTSEETEIAARVCFYYLRHGGYLRVAVPDGLHPDPTYIDWVRPGGVWNGDDHKQLFTYSSLASLLTGAGFRVRLLEWFDERRQLHTVEINSEEGAIKRSCRSIYSAFLSLIVGAHYTSLVVDAVKPV